MGDPAFWRFLGFSASLLFLGVLPGILPALYWRFLFPSLLLLCLPASVLGSCLGSLGGAWVGLPASLLPPACSACSACVSPAFWVLCHLHCTALWVTGRPGIPRWDFISAPSYHLSTILGNSGRRRFLRLPLLGEATFWERDHIL